MDITTRPAAEDDWRLLREVRLRALADAPDAFGALLSAALDLTEDDWRSRTQTSPLIVLALTEDRPVAMGGVFRPAQGESAWIWGMWTAPEARGQGVGGRILDALVTWCREQGDGDPAYDEVRLHVTEGNLGARRLYTGRGFAPTGVWEDLRAGSPLRAEELRLGLRSARGSSTRE